MYWVQPWARVGFGITYIALDEAAYQATVKLMESGAFADAKKRFEALGRYKNSIELSRNCEMELLLIRKNQKIGMMKAGYYGHALAAFWELEEQGIDCSTEIKECELGYLEQFSVPPCVTRGKPKGQEKKVPCTDKGKVKVHSMTRVDLDNGCEYVNVSIDLDGDTVTYSDWSEQP